MPALQERWNQAVADARKILGNNAKIPNGKMSVALRADNDTDKVFADYAKARDEFSKKILAMQDAYSRVKNALGQADDEVDDSDYGMDNKKPDEKKKIDQADALFSKFFADMEGRLDNYLKQLGEVNRHMEHVTKYKITKA
ncbi:MAG TPA: hypothetical protein VMB03_20890 [Bryobacteraceae bacterium]|nr:hypothetical protein [Bryobacteraceae bacterium]